jgi:hypothetical protein
LDLAQGWHWNDAAGPFRLVLRPSLIPGLPIRSRRYLGAVGNFGVGDFSRTRPILAGTLAIVRVRD